MRLIKLPISDVALSEDSAEVRKAYRQGMQRATFLNHVKLADSAMDGRALLTTRESVDVARRAITDFLEQWRKAREVISQRHPELATPIPEPKELECRLHLMTAVAECIATDQTSKEYLPMIYRSHQTAGKPEIRAALATADHADPKYASKWIEHLSHWDLGSAYSELIRGLPSEEELTLLEEHGALRVFDALELVNIAKVLQHATASLSHIQERRTSALVKLGPALEVGFLSVPASIIHGDLLRMLEILTGTQVATGTGSQL